MAVRALLLVGVAALALPSCASPSARPARGEARAAPAPVPTPTGADQGASRPRPDGAREAPDAAEGQTGGGGHGPRLRTEPGNVWADLDGWYAPRKPVPRPSAAARDRAAAGQGGGGPVPGAPPLAGEEGDFWAGARDRR
ncbi:hypothetical protein GCM10009416_51540 [Craurococcus roseus]|uniref:Uncharacterized protein n=1 Tax=Craurococcus roseus TaxID=77585 RepID=A0ABN1GC97_9PROT